MKRTSFLASISLAIGLIGLIGAAPVAPKNSEIDELKVEIRALKAKIEALEGRIRALEGTSGHSGASNNAAKPKPKAEGKLWRITYYGVNGARYEKILEAESRDAVIKRALNMRIPLEKTFDGEGRPEYSGIDEVSPAERAELEKEFKIRK